MCQRLVGRVPPFADHGRSFAGSPGCTLEIVFMPHGGYCYRSPEFRILMSGGTSEASTCRAHTTDICANAFVEFRRRANLAGHRGRNIVSTARK